MDQAAFDRLRLELSVRAKNGIDFITSAAIVWLILAWIWTLPHSAYNRSIYTFVAGSITIPLAFALSKVFKTSWKTPGNPLEPLGLWLNFAQLFYFPFLVFILLTYSDYFVMSYAIITGAHLFPYAWYYKSSPYAVAAGVISIGAMLLGMSLPLTRMWALPLSMSAALAVLAVSLRFAYQKNARELTRVGSSPT
ncbi:MAG TPA: hypothetical protein VK843_15800 [Planctomycetota bacterium]|nr:hypothetical protein [Planctomycetota bacterium]